ncbi:MAG: TetR/AcrR family transcriptional regulator [Bacteroidetes bacterium]|nr:TetR/AcrR family transcriptional regulator [Bacteroidota bacterium]
MRTRDADKEKLVKQKAIEMLVQDGFQGFSMNKLAKAADISVATLYIYYKDKDDLIKKIGADIGKEFMSMTLKDFSADMHFAEGLKKQWENRSAFALKYPKEVACYEIIRHSAHGEYVAETSWKGFRDVMGEFCAKAIKNKELISVPTDVFWSVAYGPLYTLLRFHDEGKSIGGRTFKFSKKIMDEAFELVLKALTPKKNK